MRNKCIGTISKVFFNKIVIDIPSPSDIHHNYKGDVYICNGLNDYLTIYKDINHKFIFQIIGLYEQEKPFNEQEESKFYEKAYFEAVPVGEILENRFEYGLSTFPMISEEVYLTTVDDIKYILLPDNDSLSISLGQLSTHQYVPKLSVDSLFTNHLSILGNTGSGKSTTVRKILNELLKIEEKNFDIDKLNFIIFDVHNEYQCFDSKHSSYICTDDISIPLETLTAEDWINLVQPSSAVQLPVLMNGLKMASIISNNAQHFKWIRAFCAMELYNNQQTDAVTKRSKIVGLLEKLESVDIKRVLALYNAQYGNFSGSNENDFKRVIFSYIEEVSGVIYEKCQEKLMKLLEEASNKIISLTELKLGIDIVLLLEESKGNSQVRSHCSTLITRIDNLILNYSKTLFDQDGVKINNFIEITQFRKAFTIFDCSSFDDNDLLFFTSYLIREVFEKQKVYRQENGTINNLYNFILDEAHKYLTDNNQEDRMKSLKVFEKIAKEGRKFGIFLMIASQRPNELSKTVLSQCNNFILHRIRNNIDLEQMRKSIPYINDSQLFRLSFLKTGVVLTVGESFVVPMEIQIDGKEYGKESETIKPSDIWRKKEVGV
jgi:uncharacterized protein